MKAKFVAAMLTSGMILAAAPAQAQTPPADAAAIEIQSVVEQPASVLAPSAVVDPAAVAPAADILSDAELADQRGGEAIVVTNQTLTAITSGNVLNGDYMAGAVTLSDNALSGFNGVGNLLINTGAQVSLQTGMNLTINVTDN